MVAAGIIWSGFSQCLCSRLLSQKQWFTKCFGHRFSLNISALSCSGCTGSIEGSWKRSSRLRAEVWETENEIETEWIRRGVREIRTLPQEAGLNSSSPCMVKTPPKATGSSWEYSQSPAKYKSHSHGNSGTDQSVYERKLVKVVWSAWCHTNTMRRQMLSEVLVWNSVADLPMLDVVMLKMHNHKRSQGPTTDV